MPKLARKRTLIGFLPKDPTDEELEQFAAALNAAALEPTEPPAQRQPQRRD